MCCHIASGQCCTIETYTDGFNSLMRSNSNHKGSDACKMMVCSQRAISLPILSRVRMSKLDLLGHSNDTACFGWLWLPHVHAWLCNSILVKVFICKLVGSLIPRVNVTNLIRVAADGRLEVTSNGGRVVHDLSEYVRMYARTCTGEYA